MLYTRLLFLNQCIYIFSQTIKQIHFPNGTHLAGAESLSLTFEFTKVTLKPL